MLAIRMQRTGRKGHAQFRVVVQDSRRTPTSGNIVANLGSYNPHTKIVILDKEKAAYYLGNGAQPSERAARLLKAEGVKLPSWVKLAEPRTGTIRNPEKLRSNQPAPTEKPSPVEDAPEAVAEEVPEATTEATPAEEPAPEEPAQEAEAVKTEDAEEPKEEPKTEA